MRKLLVLFLLCRVFGTDLEEVAKDIPWEPHFGHGVWQVEGGVALVPIFALAPDQQLLAVDVAAASAVLYHPEGGARDGVAVSPKQVEVFVDVAGDTTTEITLWYRVRRTTAPEDARFLQGIDASLGAPVGWVDVTSPAGEWAWVRAKPQPELRPHRHELQLTGIPAGIEWDQLAISRDPNWKPPAGRLADTATPTTPKQGTVTTADALFPEVRQWLRLVPSHLDPRSGSVDLEVSTDRGESWHAVPDDGSLADIPAAGDGRDRIRVRATLRREDDSPGPLLGEPRVTYATPADATFAVDAGNARWIFARRTGALCGLVHRETGTALMPVDRPVPLFELRLKPQGYCPDDAWIDFDGMDFEPVETAVDERPDKGFVRQLRSRYRLQRDDGTVDVLLRVAFTANGEAHWTSELTNGLTDLEVGEFTWPVLDNVKTTPAPETDKVLLGGNYLFAGPCRVGRFFYSLPGTLLMPMLDLSGEAEGVTLVGRDATYRNTMMACQGQRQAGVRLSLHKVLALKPGQTYTGPPNVVRVHAGDWRHACLLEQPHVRDLYPRAPDILPSVREMDGVEMRGWPVPRWDRFGAFGEKLRQQHGFLHLGIWNFQVPKTYWNTPHPNPMMGHAEDLKWAVRAFRRSGMRINFYIQSVLTSPLYEGIEPDDYVGYVKAEHLWPGWELPPAGWNDRNRSRQANGEGHVYSRSDLEVNIPMAHGGHGFHDYKMTWAVDRFGRQIGLDGIYWDSNSNAQPSWGTNDRYGDDPGMSARALLDTQRAINQAYGKLRPGGVWTWGEGSPNAFMDQVRHVHLANAYTLYPIRMLFPDMVLVPSGANGQDTQMHKAFLAGARLYGNRRGHGELQMAMIAMRRKVSQYLYPATYRHDVDLQVSDERVQASLALCDPSRTRGAVLNILNLEQVDGATITVDTALFGPVRTAWLIASDGREERFEVPVGDTVELPVPTAEAAHILLFNRAEPRLGIEEVIGPVAEGRATPVRVTVESLDGRRQQGELTIRHRPGLRGSRVAFDTTDRQTLDMLLAPDLGAVNDIFDLQVEVDCGPRPGWVGRLLQRDREGPTFTRSFTVYVHEPVTWEFAHVSPEQARLRLTNQTDSPATLGLDLRAGQGSVRLATGPTHIDLELAANERRDLLLDLEGAAAAEHPWRLRGSMTCRIGRHAQEIELYRQFWPIIANGSLEHCDFRPDPPEKEYYAYAKTPDKMVHFMRHIPDYWWGMQSDRSPQVSHHDGLSLDEQTAADGKRSFRLAAESRARANIVIELDAGTRYRFTAALRAEQPTPDCRVQLGNGVLRLTADHAPNEWHTLTTEFIANQDGGNVYFFTSDESATWFDALNAVPLSAPGEAE